MSASDDLHLLGMAVVPVIRDECLKYMNEAVWTAIEAFPEYKTTDRTARRADGDALCNPSSFHHPTIRVLRALMKHVVAAPLLRELARARELGDDVHYEALFDRLVVWNGAVGSREKASNVVDKDHNETIVRGFLHLGEAPFAFDCIPWGPSVEEVLPSCSYGATVRTDAAGKVIVPAGHAVFFLPHQVLRWSWTITDDAPALLLRHSYRLATSKTSSTDGMVLRDGGVPRLPCGEVARAPGKRIATAFCDACLTKSGSVRADGAQMPSLRRLGLFVAGFVYSAADIGVLQPERLFRMSSPSMTGLK